MTTIAELAQTIKRQDYQTAKELLRELMATKPEDPWIKFYLARIHEAEGKVEAALSIYRQLLTQVINPQILVQARQGIQRITDLAAREQEIDLKIAREQHPEAGLLLLKPIHPEVKSHLLEAFAQIFGLDVYTARLRLPSRCWRLYRTGNFGELLHYHQQLQRAEIPSFVLPVKDLCQVKVYSVRYFQALTPQAIAICGQSPTDTTTITFDWSEVTQRVTALLPLIADYQAKNYLGKLETKTTTTDYIPVWDLHLPHRSLILRLCEQNYQFDQDCCQPQLNKTSRQNWQRLEKIVVDNTGNSQPWTDFSTFATTALDFPNLLTEIPDDLKLLRRKDTLLDKAFELYSRLVFIDNIKKAS